MLYLPRDYLLGKIRLNSITLNPIRKNMLEDGAIKILKLISTSNYEL